MTTTVDTLPNTCRCGTRWSGTRTAHCGADGCHHSFVNPETFDQHRRHGRCTPPDQLGMTQVAGRPYPCWGTPTEDQP